MKILTISDIESVALWDYFDRKRLDGIDLILSCGDLDPRYLSLLATFFRGPVLYVHGNHDKIYEQVPPEGCICIEDRLYEFGGLRILGLGGSMRYKPGPHQYTEAQMRMRAAKLWPRLALSHGFDILLTHAPARGFGDSTDLCHRGFDTFTSLINRYQPSYHVHGHVHLNYSPTVPRVQKHGVTTVINAYERYILDL